MKNRLITLFISIVSIFIIVELVRSIYSLWQKGRIVSEREAVKQQLTQENSDLKRQLAEVESPQYIEKQAREKLNLQKEGEIVVVIPKNLETDEPKNQPEKELSNLQKWWRLLF